jgi:hypothetical protein
MTNPMIVAQDACVAILKDLTPKEQRLAFSISEGISETTLRKAETETDFDITIIECVAAACECTAVFLRAFASMTEEEALEFEALIEAEGGV